MENSQICRLNDMLLTNKWVKEKVKKEVRKYLKNKNIPKFVECNKNSSKREVYINKCLPQETRKVLNNLTLPLKEVEKEQTKSKVCRRDKITKIRVEINET